MCLDRLRKPDDKWPKYQREDGDIIGFKTFFRTNRYLYSLMQGKMEKYFPLNEWLNEKDYRKGINIYAKFINSYNRGKPVHRHSNKPPYSFGFHVCLNIRQAQQWVDRADFCYIVKVRGIVARGFQGTYPVIVAKEMMILRKA